MPKAKDTTADTPEAVAEPTASEDETASPTDAEPKPKRGTCTITPGRSVTLTAARIATAGQSVTADDLAGGKEALDALVKAGVITRH